MAVVKILKLNYKDGWASNAKMLNGNLNYTTNEEKTEYGDEEMPAGVREIQSRPADEVTEKNLNYIQNEEKTTIDSLELDEGDMDDYIKALPPERRLGAVIQRVAKEKGRESFTVEGRYITGIGCHPESAAAEMISDVERWRKVGKDSDRIMVYHIIQSFPPEDSEKLTFAEVHKMGVLLAMELGGDFKAVVATHTNTPHYHNHITICAYDEKDGHKFLDNKTTFNALRYYCSQMSEERGLTPTEFQTGRDYSDWAKYRYEKTHREQIEEDLQICLETCDSWDEVREKMEQDFGYKVEDGGKATIYTRPEWNRKIRDGSLKGGLDKWSICTQMQKKQLEREDPNMQGIAFERSKKADDFQHLPAFAVQELETGDEWWKLTDEEKQALQKAGLDDPDTLEQKLDEWDGQEKTEPEAAVLNRKPVIEPAGTTVSAPARSEIKKSVLLAIWILLHEQIRLLKNMDEITVQRSWKQQSLLNALAVCEREGVRTVPELVVKIGRTDAERAALYPQLKDMKRKQEAAEVLARNARFLKDNEARYRQLQKLYPDPEKTDPSLTLGQRYVEVLERGLRPDDAERKAFLKARVDEIMATFDPQMSDKLEQAVRNRQPEKVEALLKQMRRQETRLERMRKKQEKESRAAASQPKDIQTDVSGSSAPDGLKGDTSSLKTHGVLDGSKENPGASSTASGGYADSDNSKKLADSNSPEDHAKTIGAKIPVEGEGQTIANSSSPVHMQTAAAQTKEAGTPRMDMNTPGADVNAPGVDVKADLDFMRRYKRRLDCIALGRIADEGEIRELEETCNALAEEIAEKEARLSEVSEKLKELKRTRRTLEHADNPAFTHGEKYQRSMEAKVEYLKAGSFDNAEELQAHKTLNKILSRLYPEAKMTYGECRSDIDEDPVLTVRIEKDGIVETYHGFRQAVSAMRPAVRKDLQSLNARAERWLSEADLKVAGFSEREIQQMGMEDRDGAGFTVHKSALSLMPDGKAYRLSLPQKRGRSRQPVQVLLPVEHCRWLNSQMVRIDLPVSDMLEVQSTEKEAEDAMEKMRKLYSPDTYFFLVSKQLVTGQDADSLLVRQPKTKEETIVEVPQADCLPLNEGRSFMAAAEPEIRWRATVQEREGDGEIKSRKTYLDQNDIRSSFQLEVKKPSKAEQIKRQMPENTSTFIVPMEQASISGGICQIAVPETKQVIELPVSKALEPDGENLIVTVRNGDSFKVYSEGTTWQNERAAADRVKNEKAKAAADGSKAESQKAKQSGQKRYKTVEGSELANLFQPVQATEQRERKGISATTIENAFVQQLRGKEIERMVEETKAGQSKGTCVLYAACDLVYDENEERSLIALPGNRWKKAEIPASCIQPAGATGNRLIVLPPDATVQAGKETLTVQELEEAFRYTRRSAGASGSQKEKEQKTEKTQPERFGR